MQRVDAMQKVCLLPFLNPGFERLMRVLAGMFAFFLVILMAMMNFISLAYDGVFLDFRTVMVFFA